MFSSFTNFITPPSPLSSLSDQSSSSSTSTTTTFQSLPQFSAANTTAAAPVSSSLLLLSTEQKKKEVEMMLDENQIKLRFPLHYLVWNDDKEGLKKILKQSSKPNLELKDCRGRTALMLSVTLGHKKCTRILLNHNASVNVTDSSGFNVLHEAVTSADPEFIRDVYEQKEVQRYSRRVDAIPNLLSKICDTTDFYLEMKWEFTSWVPLISRLCPNDTYKIYKRGSNVRVDTTLVGMDGATNWQRGQKSFIFSGSENRAVFMEVDHDDKLITKKTMKVITQEEISEFLQPTEAQICDRLSNPISTTYLDTEKICFERAKSGIYGFRTDRTETINGYDCKVFSANTVELVTKVRTEHLTNDDKNRLKMAESSSRLSMLKSFGITETVVPNSFENVELDDCDKRNPFKLTLLEYFNSASANNSNSLNSSNNSSNDSSNVAITPSKDIGIPRELTIKSQNFKVNLWLSEEFPLLLPEQVLPIVDLMAISSSHFAKLRDFITLKFPAGFPVRIEIPLFHVLNARITFGNIFSSNESVPGVSFDGNSCTVDESCFEPPSHYEVIGDEQDDGQSLNGAFNDDEEYNVQFALEQYFRNNPDLAQLPNGGGLPGDGGTISVNGATDQVTLFEALKTDEDEVEFDSKQNSPKQQQQQRLEDYPGNDSDLQRAIQLSLLEYQNQKRQQQQQTQKQHLNSESNDNENEDDNEEDEFFDSSDQMVVATAAANSTTTLSTRTINEKKSNPNPNNNDDDDLCDSNESLLKLQQHRNMLQYTIEKSRADHDEDQRLRNEEEETLQKVLQLSLSEK